MTALSYAEQLRHPNWQRKRLQILERDEWSCQACLARDRELHVHHKVYVKGRLAWEYADEELQTLCKDCHQTRHELEQELKALLAEVSPGEAIELLTGYITVAIGSDEESAVFDTAPLRYAGMLARTLEAMDWEDAQAVGRFVRERFMASVNRGKAGGREG